MPRTADPEIERDASPVHLISLDDATMDREMERLMQQAQAAGMAMRTDQATPDKSVDHV